MSKTVDTIIIGAGPSGLTASLEMCRSGQTPIIMEQGDYIGGLMHSPKWNDFTIDRAQRVVFAYFRN